MSDNDEKNKPSNVKVLEAAGAWSPEMAMIAAMGEVEEMVVCAVYWKTADGRHRTITSSMSPGDLLIGGKLIERRGLMALEGFYTWPT